MVVRDGVILYVTGTCARLQLEWLRRHLNMSGRLGGKKGLIRTPPNIGSMRRAHRIQLVALSNGTGLSLIQRNKPARGRPPRPSADSDYNHGGVSSSFDPMLHGLPHVQGRGDTHSAPWNLRCPRNPQWPR